MVGRVLPLHVARRPRRRRPGRDRLHRLPGRGRRNLPLRPRARRQRAPIVRTGNPLARSFQSRKISKGRRFAAAMLAVSPSADVVQCRRSPDSSLRAATRRSAKSRPSAASRRSRAGSFGTVVRSANALMSARIRCEAAGATFVSTAALMERASARRPPRAIPGGRERRASASRSDTLSL